MQSRSSVPWQLSHRVLQIELKFIVIIMSELSDLEEEEEESVSFYSESSHYSNSNSTPREAVVEEEEEEEESKYAQNHNLLSEQLLSLVGDCTICRPMQLKPGQQALQPNASCTVSLL